MIGEARLSGALASGAKREGAGASVAPLAPFFRARGSRRDMPDLHRSVKSLIITVPYVVDLLGLVSRSFWCKMALGD